MNPMMKCGHAANAVDADGQPVCIICVGRVAGARDEDTVPDLTGRQARCVDNGARKPCKGAVPSSTSLPFFRHQPDKPEDTFYCGCWGWD